MDIEYFTPKKRRYLNFLDRCCIFSGLNRGDSIKEISDNILFSRQTIHAEIKRGTIEQLKSDLTNIKKYDPYAGEAYKSKTFSYKGRMSKVVEFKELKETILNYLHVGYSPEVIEYFIKNDEILSSKDISISAKSIYNSIYSGILGIDPKEVLPYAKCKKKKRIKTEKNKIKPNGGESIELRPKIDDRLEFGHWEIDCVVGKRNGKNSCLMTLVERKTRYGIVIKIKNKTKKSIVKAISNLKKYYGKYFYDIFKSITCDNGSEFKDAIGMSMLLKCGKKVKIYFSHSYCSYERGSNENFNRFIRRYFPKGTNFNDVSIDELQERIEFINNYPRKVLKFSSSTQLFSLELAKLR